MLEIIKYIILGIVQGFTEPLPISSSGHLIIFQEFFEMNINDLTFEIFANFGSLIAIIIIYFKDIITLVKEFFLFIFTRKEEYKYNFKFVILLIIATIPAVILGFLLKDYIESTFTNLITVGTALLFTAIFLNFAHTMQENDLVKKEEITYMDSLVIGLSQSVALIPGISRSGATLVGGMSRGITVKETLKFSFLLYIPISIGAMVLGLSDVLNSNTVINVPAYTSGVISSFIFTIIGIKLLFKIVNNKNLKYFSIYCLAMGLLVISYVIFI